MTSKRILFGLALSLAGAAAAMAGAAPTSAGTRPFWLARPSGDDIERVYPRRAERAGISGEAELDCRVRADGYLEQCRVFAEAPVGAGFGAAALALAPKFRVRPPDQSTTGAPPPIHIPILFSVSRTGPRPPELWVLNTPRWASAPTFDDVASAYPATANAASADVTLRCRVDSGGTLGLCETMEERPERLGFADAARLLVSRFRLDPEERSTEFGDRFVADLKFHFIDPRSEDFVKRRIAEPTWLDSPDQVAAAAPFPAAAAAKGLKAGQGVASCAVAADGRLKDCAPMAADPDGVGFSEAAVKIASMLKINPWTDAGGPVDGAHVEVPIRFALSAVKP